MCPNDSLTCTLPLLPERVDALLDSEVNSDVIFLVGKESEASRVPGHKSVLAAASPVFRAMFQSSLCDGPVITIPDVDRRAFDQLLRYLYGENVQLQSVYTALTTLYAAHKYECEGLERSCLAYLASHLSPSHVLDIYQDISVYCNSVTTDEQSDSLTQGRDWAPSAPTLETVECKPQSYLVPVHTKTTNKENCNIATCYEALLRKCLQYIDLNADAVLQQEQIEEFSRNELCSIVQRETLGVTSEKIVFKVLERWSNFQCKSNKWELSTEKRREALGAELLFSPRYLLMTSEEFMSGPMTSNLLDRTETAVLLGLILKHSEIQKCPKYLEDMLPSLGRPRHRPLPMIGEVGMNGCLSRRSSVSTLSASGSNRDSSKTSKKAKKAKKQKIREEGNLDERKMGFTDYFFGCVACIFD